MTKEKDIERYLVTSCTRLGVLCYKFTSPSNIGVPDRILIGRDNSYNPQTIFCELKRPGEKPRPSQRAVIDRLESRGAHVVVIDSFDGVDTLIEQFSSGHSISEESTPTTHTHTVRKL